MAPCGGETLGDLPTAVADQPGDQSANGVGERFFYSRERHTAAAVRERHRKGNHRRLIGGIRPVGEKVNIIGLERAQVPFHLGSERRVDQVLYRRDGAKARLEIDQARAARHEEIPDLLIGPDVRPAEPVNRLLGIPNNEKLAWGGTSLAPASDARFVRRQKEKDFRLQRIGVLELIDQDVGEAPLELGPDVIVVAHQIAGPDQKVHEIQPAQSLLELLVAIDAFAELLVQQGGEVRVSRARERCERAGQRRMRRQCIFAARGPAPVGIITLARFREAAVLSQLDQPGFDSVIVARPHPLCVPDSIAHLPALPGIVVKSVFGVGAGTGHVREVVDLIHQKVHLVVARPGRVAAPGSREVAPRGKLPARPPESCHGALIVIKPGHAPERAAHAFRRIFELLLQPEIKGLPVDPFGLRLRKDLEARIDSSFHRPFAQQVGTKAVDRADARLFQVGQGLLEVRTPPLVARVRGARRFQLDPQSQLELAGRLLRERHRDNSVDGGAPFGDQIHDPPYELARLPGARGRLHDQGLVERRAYPLSSLLVGHACHGSNTSVRFPGEQRLPAKSAIS